MGLSDTARWVHHGTVSDSGGGQTDRYQLLTTAGTYYPGGTIGGVPVTKTEAQLSAYTWGSTTNYPCRIDALTGNEELAGARLSDRSTHLVTFQVGTLTLSTDDDLMIQNRGRYEVTAIREHTSEFATQVEVTGRI